MLKKYNTMLWAVFMLFPFFLFQKGWYKHKPFMHTESLKTRQNYTAEDYSPSRSKWLKITMKISVLPSKMQLHFTSNTLFNSQWSKVSASKQIN